MLKTTYSANAKKVEEALKLVILGIHADLGRPLLILHAILQEQAKVSTLKLLPFPKEEQELLKKKVNETFRRLFASQIYLPQIEAYELVHPLEGGVLESPLVNILESLSQLGILDFYSDWGIGQGNGGYCPTEWFIKTAIPRFVSVAETRFTTPATADIPGEAVVKLSLPQGIITLQVDERQGKLLFSYHETMVLYATETTISYLDDEETGKYVYDGLALRCNRSRYGGYCGYPHHRQRHTIIVTGYHPGGKCYLKLSPN